MWVCNHAHHTGRGTRRQARVIWAKPFTNNHAEQILRMIKVRQKISGCFRTTVGAKRFLRVRSYIDTVRKHDLSIFQALVDAVAGRPFMPTSAA